MKQRNRLSDTQAKGGFALVIALTMMAFVLVLLVTMTLLVNVETASSQTTLNQLRAKESARLALMMALGDLQRYAGPDQRVTARAEILGSELASSNPFWTGAWEAASPTAVPHWMVSWQDQSSQTPPNETMQLLGGGSGSSDTTDHVSAPVIHVIGNDNSTNAKIAWWISDDGVKASAGHSPRHLRSIPNFLEPESFEALDLLIASSQGLETIFPNYDRFNLSGAAHLDRVFTYKQLLAQSDFLETDADFSEEAPYHSIAPFSLGVLSNTLSGTDGGLMRDLSLFPELLGSGVEEFLQLGETHAEAQDQLGDTVAGKRLFTQIQGIDAIGPLNDGDIATPIAPILSNFMMAFTIRQNAKTDPNLYLRMVFFCEFWNPYTHSISTNDTSGNPIELQLEITGLPEVKVEKYSEVNNTDGSTTLVLNADANVPIQDVVGDSTASDSPLVIKLKNNDLEEWIPGRTKNWVGVDADENATTSPYDSIINISKAWTYNSRKLGNTIGIDTNIDLATGDGVVRHSTTDETPLRIKVYSYNSTTGAKKLIAEYGDITYEPFETLNSDGSLFDSKHKDITFGYHFILREPHQALADTEYYRGRWLFDDDPRNLQPTFHRDWQIENDDTAETGSPYVPVIDGIAAIAIPQPEAINQFNGTINFPIFRRLIDRSDTTVYPIVNHHYNKLWQDAPLFELPRDRILSLASLQHLYFHNERPFQVGNSWGSDGANNTSEWFDRYYFSGISRNDDPTDFSTDAGPTNPGLVFYQSDDFATSLADWKSDSASDSTSAKSPAEVLMVANRFNINSTSVAAWKTVLSSLRLNDFEYLDYPEDDTSDLSSLTINQQSRVGSFARFSHSLEETYEAPATPQFEGTESVAPSAFYRHGARRFDDDEFEAFAQEIVNLIKERGAPFTTMESFISAASGDTSSLIEKAIETVFTTSGRQQWDHQWETTGVRGSTSEIIDIDHFSPGFLTQADVLTAIGPMLAPRSDTFTVRTRGDSINFDGQAEATAYLEATFQRTPETVDPTATPTSSSDRRFILISLRWLSEEEV